MMAVVLHRRLVLRRWLLLAVAGWLIPLHAADAQLADEDVNIDTGGLTIEAVVGWNGSVDTSWPVPLSFSISNFSGQDIDGRLTIRDADSSREVSLGSVFVGQGGTTRFSCIHDLSEWSRCYVTLTEGRDRLWRRELPIVSQVIFGFERNFALYVDVDNRDLPLPESPDASPQKDAVGSETSLKSSDGRKVSCITVNPWMLPRHIGPLTNVQAIILADDRASNDLNHLQWRALAEWTCQGGTVFVSESQDDAVQQLLKAAPLESHRSEAAAEAMIHQIGLGRIWQFAGSLRKDTDVDSRREIARLISRTRQNEIYSAQAFDSEVTRGTNATRNRLRIVGFFAVYMLLSGVVPLVLVRSPKKRIAVFTATIVLCAAVLAGLLGGYLRSGKGDIRLTTIAQLTPDGAIEIGHVTVQSAGGRDSLVSVEGNRIDLQMSGPHTNTDFGYYSGRYANGGPQTGYSPFTWQPNLVSDVPGRWRTKVPITPWGCRRLQATAYHPEWQPHTFKLTYSPPKPAEPVTDDSTESGSQALETEFAAGGYAGSPVAGGTFGIHVINQLPVAVTDVQIVIGTIHERPATANDSSWTKIRGQNMRNGQDSNPGTMIAVELYQFMPVLRDLAPGEEFRKSVPARLEEFPDAWQRLRTWQQHRGPQRNLNHAGESVAWLTGQISSSATLRIDHERSDYVDDEEGRHYFIQRILPEDMPDLPQLLRDEYE